MENVHCSPIQHMVVKNADYGDFDNFGTFDSNTNIDMQCSKLANCQVKSLCSGKRSCDLTMDNNLLPSQYCSDTSKEIYTQYTCVDKYNSNTITGKAGCSSSSTIVIRREKLRSFYRGLILNGHNHPLRLLH